MRTRSGSGSDHGSAPSASCAATAAATAGTRIAEHGVEAVARRLHDEAVGPDDRLADELVVARQRGAHRVRMLTPEARRTLEIREQERHGPRRAVLPRRPVSHPDTGDATVVARGVTRRGRAARG